MIDHRITQLADLLVSYSNDIQPKERAMVICYGLEGLPLAKEVYRLCMEKGAYATYEIRDDEFGRIFYENAQDHHLDSCPDWLMEEAKNTDAMFQIICDRNTMELAHIDQQKMIRKRKATKKLSDVLHEKKWVLFEYPTDLGAYNAKMSLKAWEDFVFNSCLVDWKKAEKEQEVLKQLILKTDEVKIIADETDLTVNIKDQEAKKCCGKCNMPDGEVFTAPVRDGVNGHIKFNTPTMYMNKEFNWVKIWFEDGKAVKTDSDNKEALDEILDTDEGARHLGEFAFGTNKNIQLPVKSILFDEKIGGSTHMAFGKCYEEAPNGNDSNIHWDMIIRHKDANGKVYFDGELIQENGVWVHPDLKMFN